MQIECKKCHKIFEMNDLTKTKVLDILKYMRNNKNCIYFECADCKNKRINREREASEKWNEERIERIKNKTQKYIELYLDPNMSWRKDKKISAYEKWKEISNFYEIDENAVCDYINDMDYSDFLNTPYWKAIAEYKRKRANYCCELCSRNRKLHIHHKTYEHHGYEHRFKILNQDLICLCENCHTKFHDKLEN